MRISDWSSDVCSSDLREACRVVEVQLEERLALAHLVADGGTPHDPGHSGHRVLLAGPAGAEAPGRHSHRHRVELAAGAGGRGGDDLYLARPGGGGVRVAALGPHPPLPGLPGPALEAGT